MIRYVLATLSAGCFLDYILNYCTGIFVNVHTKKGLLRRIVFVKIAHLALLLYIPKLVV